MTADHIAQIPFYLDWKFLLGAFSLTVSIVAVILSQLPPLHILLRRAKLDIEAYDSLLLMHRVGNPVAQMHLIISNTGGKEIRVKGIDLHFRHDSGDRFTLPAQGYLQAPNDSNFVLLTSFRLVPNQEWGHIVNFFMRFARKEEKEYRQLEANLKDDIFQKRSALEDKDVVVSADEKAVQPLLKFFREKFRWQPGEYELTVEVRAEPAKASVSKRYRITLFESDSKELEDHCDDYKYGWGVFLGSSRPNLFVPLTEA
jgi:hypothetical protein